MGKKQKKVDFICPACGKELSTEADFLKHCAKKHPNDPYIVFDTLGHFVNLDHATSEYARLNSEFLRQRQEVFELKKSLQEHKAEIQKFVSISNVYAQHEGPGLDDPVGTADIFIFTIGI
jgi:hypothetical protein